MLFIQQSTDPDAIVDQQDEDDAFYAATLREMVALGLDIARIIHQQVVAASIDAPHAAVDDQASVAYERVFRAVRRGVALAKRLNQPFPEPKPLPARRHGEARRQIIREIGDLIETQAPDKTERLYADLRDRLDTEDFDKDLENQTIPEILDEIRKDLGLASTPSSLSLRESVGVKGSRQHHDHHQHSHPGTTPPAPGMEREEKPSPACGRGLGEGKSISAGPPNDTPPTKGPPYPPGS